MRNALIDDPDVIVGPWRNVQRLADEYAGISDARTLLLEAGAHGISEMIARHNIGVDVGALAGINTVADKAREVAAALTLNTAMEQARGLIDTATLQATAEQMRLVTSAMAGRDRFAGCVLAELEAIGLNQGVSLIRDAMGLTQQVNVRADDWSRLADPFARMQTLMAQIEPLGQLIDRYVLVNPLQDTLTNLQWDWDHGQRGLVDLARGMQERLAYRTALDAPIAYDEWSDDAPAEVDDDVCVAGPEEAAATPSPEVVPELFIASRFVFARLLVRERTARLAARFDARAAGDPHALGSWLLIIAGCQPAYAARIATLSRGVLHGILLLNASLQGLAGTTVGGGLEELTISDAQEFDEAVAALVEVLEEIEAL